MDAVRLTPTRVHRFYRGGALLAELRGEQAEDGFFPEEWIGSVTPANNPGRADPEEGLSRLADGRLLRDAVADDPIGWLGEEHVARFGTSTGVLVKLLDAAERLPVHAHPDRAFARRAFDSPFGKTEAWLVAAHAPGGGRGVGRSAGGRGARALPRVDPGTGRRGAARLAEPRRRSRRATSSTFPPAFPMLWAPGS